MQKKPSKTNSEANKHMEKCSMSLVINDMQIKIPIRYHYILTAMAKMINYNNIK